MAQNGDAGVKPQLLPDLLAHGDAAGRALGHHDHKVGLAAEPRPADLLGHMQVEVVCPLRHQHRRSAHGHAHIQRQIPGPVAHDLHHGAALVGLHGVPQPVDAFHRRVGGGIKADGVIGADDVVVDGAGDANHRDAELGQILRAPERTVAADGHQTVQPQQLAGVGRLLLALPGAELVAPGAVQDGAAPVDDAADAGVVHLHKVPGDQTGIAPADAHALDAPGQGAAHHRADAGVHARRVAAAGQYADTLDCIVHKTSTSFPSGGAARRPASPYLILYHGAKRHGSICCFFGCPAPPGGKNGVLRTMAALRTLYHTFGLFATSICENFLDKPRLLWYDRNGWPPAAPLFSRKG